MDRPATIAAAREMLASLPQDRLRASPYWRDPERYNLVVHFLPIEVASDQALGERVAEALARPAPETCLYMHLPACTGRCTFCHYSILVNPKGDVLPRYLAQLKREIDARAPAIGKVTSVLVGGGTPTYHTADELHDILGYLKARTGIPDGVEWTVESSPETLTLEKLQAIRAAGGNRLNIGVQAFQDRHLRWLGRRHLADGARGAVELARRAGFDNVNIDLIYALPDQTVDEWLDSIDEAARLQVESITTYHLRKRPDTTISRRDSPDDMTNLLMHALCEVRLSEHGYRQNIVDYWSRAGGGHVWGQLQARDKWKDLMPVDGVGISSCSRRADTIGFNTTSIEDYGQAIDAGRLPYHSGRVLSRDEQMAQRAMLALRITHPDEGGLDLASFSREFGVSAQDVFARSIEEMLALGLIERRDDRVLLTYAGRLFADEVCERFYTEEMRETLARKLSVKKLRTATAGVAGA